MRGLAPPVSQQLDTSGSPPALQACVTRGVDMAVHSHASRPAQLSPLAWRLHIGLRFGAEIGPAGRKYRERGEARPLPKPWRRAKIIVANQPGLSISHPA